MIWETENKLYKLGVKKVTLEEFIHFSLINEGFYLNITEGVHSNDYYEAVILGNKDGIFALNVDIHGNLEYYIGNIKNA